MTDHRFRDQRGRKAKGCGHAKVAAVVVSYRNCHKNKEGHQDSARGAAR